MLKKQDYIYESDLYKIVNPNQILINEIYKKLEEHTDENGEIDINNVEVILYLLQELIDSENVDYQFDTYSIDDIISISENPPSEYKNIIYYIGNIVSDIIIEKMQTAILEVKKSHIELLKSELITRTNQFKEDIAFVERNNKRIKDERRVSSQAKEYKPIEKGSFIGKVKNKIKK